MIKWTISHVLTEMIDDISENDIDDMNDFIKHYTERLYRAFQREIDI